MTMMIMMIMLIMIVDDDDDDDDEGVDYHQDGYDGDNNIILYSFN